MLQLHILRFTFYSVLSITHTNYKIILITSEFNVHMDNSSVAQLLLKTIKTKTYIPVTNCRSAEKRWRKSKLIYFNLILRI